MIATTIATIVVALASGALGFFIGCRVTARSWERSYSALRRRYVMLCDKYHHHLEIVRGGQ